LLAELLLLAGQALLALSGLSRSALWTAWLSGSLALLDLRRATGSLLAELLLLTR